MLTDKTSKGVVSEKYTGLILIDLLKAFGTIDHEILFLKNEDVLDFWKISWLESYLLGRNCKVNIDEKISDQKILFAALLMDLY